MSAVNPTGTYNAGALVTGTYVYYVAEDDGSCVSNLQAVGITVNALPAAPVVAGASICEGDVAVLSAGSGVNWYADAGLTNLLSAGSVYTTGALTVTTDYYVTQVDANGCESASSTVTVTVNPQPAAPTSAGASICAGETAILTGNGSGGTLNWYSDASGTNLIGTGASYTTGVLQQTTIYYLQEESAAAGCLSAIVAVTVGGKCVAI